MEVQREAGDLCVPLGHDHLDEGLLAEEVGMQAFGVGLHLVEQLLVGRQVPDQGDQGRDVGRLGGSEGEHGIS
ncbi:hypothetical protein D3C86_2013770 [compost metagenome]